MLTPQDRRAIEGLFDRLVEVERRGTARDPEAEALIREETARQPGAPYYMAQTILIQEQALAMAEQRIAELEAQQQRRPSDFLGGLFGGREANRQQSPVRRGPGPWDRGARNDNRDGGFLAGAAQTALGVTGGLLLGSAIASMFGAGEAHAGETGEDRGSDQDATASPDSGDLGNDDAGGSDFGDGGGVDFGGDF